MTGTVAATLRPYLVRSACPRSISWRYSPHPARWGQCPGRFTSLASGSTPLVPVAVPHGSADGKKRPPGGQGLSHSPADGGDYPWEVTLLPSAVNGWRTGSVLSPGLRVRRSEDRLCEPQSRPRAWACMARHPVGGGHCGAHREHEASAPLRSAENLSRLQAG